AEYESPRTPVHAVFPTQGAPPNKVRTFVDFLVERYREKNVLAAESMARVTESAAAKRPA
ncbi:MAG TPA: hypothetical protein VFS52_19540, partial [Steroidobacteraceae bacterium]|nr:hypothetical protein [Steroidobacteraceae bacterium]